MSVLATTPPGDVTPRREVRRPTGLGAAVVTTILALLLAAAVYGIAVRTSWGQLVDQYVLDAARRASAVAHVPHILTVQAVTDPRIWVIAAMLAVGGSVIPAVTGRTPVGIALVKTAALLVFPVIIVVLTRYLRDGVLVRPRLHSWIAETSNSAPSGHAAAVTSCVVVLVAASPKWLRPFVVAVGATWASVIEFGLVADGWHRPSDVVISVLIVIGLGALLPGSVGGLTDPPGFVLDAQPGISHHRHRHTADRRHVLRRPATDRDGGRYRAGHGYRAGWISPVRVSLAAGLTAARLSPSGQTPHPKDAVD